MTGCIMWKSVSESLWFSDGTESKIGCQTCEYCKYSGAHLIQAPLGPLRVS